jgi:chromosome segregation ATPase
MENLESEVVRLTTELTMAKADLDGAYGTRQERKKEAGVAAQDMEALEKLKDQEIEALRKNQADRTKLLETELQDMMEEFQAMTRESLDLEKERGQLENLIDELREKVDQLEQQLADERVQAIGVKTPGGGPDPAP